LSEGEKNEERMLNYERYRTLVQNEAVGSNSISGTEIQPKKAINWALVLGNNQTQIQNQNHSKKCKKNIKKF